MSDEAEPQIGIFWYYKEQLIIHSSPAAKVKVIQGFADLATSHYQYWETLRLTDPKLDLYEYEEIPRGRVVMKAEGPQYLVYSSRQMMKDNAFRARVLQRFHLPEDQTIFESDAHYEDPSTIDWEA